MIFNTTLQEHGLNISRKGIEILQVNIGRKCNLACHHCHVEASPTRTENMDQYTADHLVKLLENSPGVHTVDFTGGAPELNPHFRKLVEASRSLNKNVIVIGEDYWQNKRINKICLHYQLITCEKIHD